MKRRLIRYWNSFFGKITLTVAAGLGLMAAVVSLVVLVMSQNVFMDTYGKSQEKTVDQIEKEFNGLHEELMNVVDTIDSSWAFRLYLAENDSLDNVHTFQNIYRMDQEIQQCRVGEIESLNVLVFGLNGRHYLSRTETISVSQEKIMESAAFSAALDDKENMYYTFSDGAYTMTTEDRDVLIASKALYYEDSKDVYAVVLITLTEDNLRPYYDYFVTDNTAFYLVDRENRVVTSDDTAAVGHTFEAIDTNRLTEQSEKGETLYEKGRYLTVMNRQIPGMDCQIYTVIDNHLALKQLYNIPLLAVICLCTGALIMALCLFYTKRTIRPLSRMVNNMQHIREGKFMEYIPVEGALEIRELAETYNRMLDDIRKYIDEIVKIQRQKRKSEIRALQMQINPHYIYNTLASIKMLVYQNDVQKTTQVIDAFISLLRNTISNDREYITIRQEIQNLNNYELIMHTRYGDAVDVEYYVSPNCYTCMIPKMILQPFIENAFFHAFPSGEKGRIQVFIKIKGNLFGDWNTQCA